MENRVTIDNLGFHASQRYAIDQKLLEESQELSPGLRENAKNIVRTAERSVVTPAFQSTCDVLVQNEQKSPSWALFTPPQGYLEHNQTLFLHTILPIISSTQAKDQYAEKIQQRVVQEISFDSEESDHDPEEWEQIKEAEEEEKEKHCLLHFLDCIFTLGQCMLYANTKRMQYHKG